jgi:hypothetical protein
MAHLTLRLSRLAGESGRLSVAVGAAIGPELLWRRRAASVAAATPKKMPAGRYS